MMVMGTWKVPSILAIAGALAWSGCGREAESVGDMDSERVVSQAELSSKARGDRPVEPSEPVIEETAEVDRDPSSPQRAQGTAEVGREEPRAQELSDRLGVVETREPQTVPRLAPREQGPATEAAAEASGERPLEGEPRLMRTDPGSLPEEPEPRPSLEPPVVPRGTEIFLTLDMALSTRTHNAGDVFSATVMEDVLAPDGMVLIPVGARMGGVVAESQESDGPEDPATLLLDFERLIIEGREISVVATMVEADVEAETRDSDASTAAKIATGTVAGAILGKILGRDTKDALKGAAAGAAAGTAVAMASRGGHATMERGAMVVVRLEESVPLIVQ
jgi:hypothetical protein